MGYLNILTIKTGKTLTNNTNASIKKKKLSRHSDKQGIIPDEIVNFGHFQENYTFQN